MADQRARTAGDYLGFFAYLAIMNGGWPDRDLLSAGYAGTNDHATESPERPHLTIVRVPPEPASGDDAEADIVAA